MAGEVLSIRALNRALLARQFLLHRERLPVAEAIGRLAALQAQDPRPPFVNLWSRLEGFRREDLLAALHDRSVVRATFLRGTLHIARAADYLAWRAVIAERLEWGARGIQQNLGVEVDTAAVNAVARPFFAAGARRFEEVRGALMAAFPTGHERAMGFTVRQTLPLVSPPEDTEWAFKRDPTFTLAETWLGAPVAPGVEPDAMVLRYLAAFGPSTITDAQDWLGLRGLKPAFERLADRLVRLKDEKKRDLWDLPDAPRPDPDTPAPPRLLDGFDGVMLGHTDRTRIMDPVFKPIIANKNLRVPAVFLVDGFVAGTWTTTVAKKSATLDLKPFEPLPKAAQAALIAEAEALLVFLAPDAGAREARVAA